MKSANLVSNSIVKLTTYPAYFLYDVVLSNVDLFMLHDGKCVKY